MAKDERLFDFKDKVIVTQVGMVMGRNITVAGVEYQVRLQNSRGKLYEVFLEQRYLSELPEGHEDEDLVLVGFVWRKNTVSDKENRV